MRQTHTIPRGSLRVRRSKTGLGLFAVAPIPRGAYIEYTGELISAEEANRRGGRYLFEINSRWTVDGKGTHNIARYINHSCKSNCESDTRGKRIVIIAKRKILPGEELTYDYGTEYVDEYIKPAGCLCNACG